MSTSHNESLGKILVVIVVKISGTLNFQTKLVQIYQKGKPRRIPQLLTRYRFGFLLDKIPIPEKSIEAQLKKLESQLVRCKALLNELIKYIHCTTEPKNCSICM